MEGSTSTSLNIPHTHVPSSLPPHYLRQIIISTLQRRGFHSGEAGALAEIERLLERHVQRTFSSAVAHSHHALRLTPDAADLLAAQGETGWSTRKLKRIAKKRRRGELDPTRSALRRSPPPGPSLKLAAVSEAQEGDRAETLGDLVDFVEEQDALAQSGDGQGPKLVEGRLEYAYEGAPSLPGRWTFAVRSSRNSGDGEIKSDITPIQVTPASLDFVKSTVTERGDISPELGIVDYRRPGGGATKRKWSVVGVGLA